MSIRIAFFYCITAFLALNATSAPAIAATVSARMEVSVTVQDTCQISATLPAAALQNHNWTHLDPASAVSVTCAYSSPYRISMSFDPRSEHGAPETVSLRSAGAPHSFNLATFPSPSSHISFMPVIDRCLLASTIGELVSSEAKCTLMERPGAYDSDSNVITFTITY